MSEAGRYAWRGAAAVATAVALPPVHVVWQHAAVLDQAQSQVRPEAHVLDA